MHQEAIQLHGAIGTTDELALGGYAKRLLVYELLFGSTREHLRRYGAMIADPAGRGHRPADDTGRRKRVPNTLESSRPRILSPAEDRPLRKCLLSRASSGAASADCAVEQRGSNAGRIRRLTASGRHAIS